MYLDVEIATNRNGFSHCTVCGGDNGIDDETVPVTHTYDCESRDALENQPEPDDTWLTRGGPDALDSRTEHDSTL